MMKNFNENDIRVAAYYNWLNSGCQNGNDLQNWSLALQQLSGNKASNKKASSKTLACKSTAAKASSKTITTKAAASKTISKTSASSKKKK